MSSYAALKEMALKKKEEEQATLNREREQKEREAAAKQAAQQAAEREQKERERKILVQRLARQKEEEARERMRKESAAKLQQDQLVDGDNAVSSKLASSSKQRLADLDKPKPKSTKTSGSTQKIDLSEVLKKSPSDAKVARRKRKADEDDFVGNRLDKIGGTRKETRSPSSSTSAPKRKAVPMTREEKQAIKRAREFGSLPKLPPIGRLLPSSGSLRSSPNTSASEDQRANRPSARKQLAQDNGLVALGTKKRDHRSIDEIERDLKKLKEAKGEGSSQGSSQAELEREAALLRRQKAMEQKRKSDQEARERAALRTEKGEDADSNDDLFGSDDDHANTRSSRKASPTKPSKRIQRPTDTNGSQNGPAKGSSPLPSAHTREPKPIASRAAGGINPADFLPGAPLRADVAARLTQKAKAASGSATSRRSPESDSPSKAKRTQPDKGSSPAPSNAPPKRETARDHFIREQEEKKKRSAVSRSSDGGLGRGRRGSRSSAEYDSEEDDEEDEYESDGVDEEDDGGDGGRMNIRDEIWKMFGKDRKKYASRIVDSDDDMEADAASVLQEELRSSKQAREEDLREEQLEKQREREKLLRKQAAQRGSGR